VIASAAGQGQSDREPPSPQRRFTVLIVVGVRLYREGLTNVLAGHPRLEVAGTAADSSGALELARALQPDVALVDLGFADGVDFVAACADDAVDMPVLGLTRSDTEEELLAVAEAGISGYVTHDTSLDELAIALESAVHGEMICSARVAATLLRHVGALARRTNPSRSAAGLTPRELEIAQLIDAGRSNKEIATELYIEIPTVKNHVHSILEKLGARRRAEAAAKLRGYGILDGSGIRTRDRGLSGLGRMRRLS
jgi:DNA-binding NarL/FixJ family response regulator